MSILGDKCSKCGANVSPGYDFCLSCGTKFSDVAPTIKVRSEYTDNRIKPSINTKKTKIFCKKCRKEVVPYKEQKTAGKRAVNFFAFIIGAGSVYTYPKRCPYCNKVLRTKTQKTVGIICVIIWITVAIIAIILTIPKYF